MNVGQGQVLVLFVILLVGILFGAVVTWWLAGSRKSNSPGPEEEKLARLRSKYLEQASIWRGRTSGVLGVRVGDQIIENPRMLNDAQIKALQTMTRDWCAWLGFSNTVPVSVPAQVQTPVVQAPVIVTPPPAAPPAASAAPSSAPETISRPSVGVTGPLSVGSQPASVPVKPKSIVEQIDEILQAKLANSPAKSKSVRLSEDPVHGVVVWIGIEHFNGVDQVTDPEVKALLREAAAEWEQNIMPGSKK
jgi:hypothetical protein